MGTSILFHLAEAGVPALLLERGSLAGGSTSKAAGGVRAQFSDDLNIAIAQRSLELFGDFGRRPGADIDLHRVGYLFLLTTPEQVASFEAGIERQHAHGVPSRLLSPEEAAELSPLLRVDDVIAAAFSPDDGHCTPEAVVGGYAAGARALGARVALGCELQRIDVAGGEIRAVETSLGRVETPAVICAAGPWSAAVGELAGVELPVAPLRRQVLFTGPM